MNYGVNILSSMKVWIVNKNNTSYVIIWIFPKFSFSNKRYLSIRMKLYFVFCWLVIHECSLP